MSRFDPFMVAIEQYYGSMSPYTIKEEWNMILKDYDIEQEIVNNPIIINQSKVLNVTRKIEKTYSVTAEPKTISPIVLGIEPISKGNKVVLNIKKAIKWIKHVVGEE